ncbi:hypothetical protein EBI_25580, partial [Enterocytozoon bieneusi H348]
IYLKFYNKEFTRIQLFGIIFFLKLHFLYFQLFLINLVKVLNTIRHLLLYLQIHLKYHMIHI